MIEPLHELVADSVFQLTKFLQAEQIPPVVARVAMRVWIFMADNQNADEQAIRKQTEEIWLQENGAKS